MTNDWTKKPWVKAPDVAEAFERARQPREKEVEKPKAKLEYKPPSPSPMGQEQHAARPLVSPQLRGEEPKSEKVRALGECQGSCRLEGVHHAASSAGVFASGLSATVGTEDQSLTFPDHRSGRFARASS